MMGLEIGFSKSRADGRLIRADNGNIRGMKVATLQRITGDDALPRGRCGERLAEQWFDGNSLAAPIHPQFPLVNSIAVTQQLIIVSSKLFPNTPRRAGAGLELREWK